MKNIRLFNVVLLLVAVLFVQDSRAQDTLRGAYVFCRLGGIFAGWDNAGFRVRG